MVKQKYRFAYRRTDKDDKENSFVKLIEASRDVDSDDNFHYWYVEGEDITNGILEVVAAVEKLKIILGR